MKESAAVLPSGIVLAGTVIVSTLPLLAVEMIPALKFVIARPHYLVFHNVAEFFSIMVSLSMFGIGWYTYDQSRNHHVLFLSIAFLGIGLMDFMHTLANAAMPPFITLNSSNKSTQFWIAARLFQAAAFLVSAYVYSEKPSRWLSKKVLLTAVLLVSALVFIGITFFPAHMSATFVPGTGLTPFKKISEYVVMALLCAAAVAYWRRMAESGDRLFVYFTAAIILCIFSELPFALYTRVFDSLNMIGHVYKVAAFFLIYNGIFGASVKAPYIRLIKVGDKLKKEIVERERTGEALRKARNNLELRVRERTAELAESNARLESEIEDRRKAQEDLRRAHDRALWLARFPDENPSPVLRISADGTVLYCNPAVLKLPGWKSAVGGALDDRLLPLVRRAMAEGKEGKQDIESGGRIYSVWVTPFPEEGYANLYGRDLTERRQAEDSLRQLNEKLEQRVAERTELAESRAKKLRMLVSELTRVEQRERRRLAEILHDHLQQLLVAAKMNCETLSTRSGPEEALILENVQNLIARSLQASRSLTAELSPPVLQQGRLSAALKWLAGWMQDNHGLTVDLQTDAAIEQGREDITLFLFQSIRELLFNVVKHAGVKSARIESARDGQNRLRITVTDQGSGFDPGTLWDRARDNSGFGLFGIRERLELLDGSLEIESSPGKGASFRLAVPLDTTGSKEDETAIQETMAKITEVKASLGKIRVLLADDHKVVRQGLFTILGPHSDIQIVGEAADGEEAVDKARKLQPDAILMDISMPKMNGIEATRIIHSEFPHIRIIGLSMHSAEDQAAEMKTAGACAYCTKDGDTAALLSAIRGAIE